MLKESKMEKKCLECKWSFISEENWKTPFRCRRFPPVVYGRENCPAVTYPEIDSYTVSCGEFQEKESK